MNGNFKVKCIENHNYWLTRGKIYETKNGVFPFDNGFVSSWGFESFSDFCRRNPNMGKKLELVKEENEVNKFKVGDKVKMISINPYFGFGEIETGDVGVISRVDRTDYLIDFPAQTRWSGREDELELIEDNQSIFITRNGNETIAVLKNGKETVKIAKAKCSPSDDFKFETGAKLAVERLFGTDKPGVKEVKRHAKDGEYIKISDALDFSQNKYKNGDILQVTESTEENGCIGFGNNTLWERVSDAEYVVLENYQPCTVTEIKSDWKIDTTSYYNNALFKMPRYGMMDALFGKFELNTLADYTKSELLEELLRREK